MKTTNKLYALKTIKRYLCKKNEELLTISYNDNRFINMCYGSFTENDTISFVLDYESGGDLYEYINRDGITMHHFLEKWFFR